MTSNGENVSIWWRHHVTSVNRAVTKFLISARSEPGDCFNINILSCQITKLLPGLTCFHLCSQEQISVPFRSRYENLSTKTFTKCWWYLRGLSGVRLILHDNPYLLVWNSISTSLGRTASLMPMVWHACFAADHLFVSSYEIRLPSAVNVKCSCHTDMRNP